MANRPNCRNSQTDPFSSFPCFGAPTSPISRPTPSRRAHNHRNRRDRRTSPHRGSKRSKHPTPLLSIPAAPCIAALAISSPGRLFFSPAPVCSRCWDRKRMRSDGGRTKILHKTPSWDRRKINYTSIPIRGPLGRLFQSEQVFLGLVLPDSA